MTRLLNSATCTWLQRHRPPRPQAWRKMGILEMPPLFTNKTLRNSSPKSKNPKKHQKHNP